MPKKLSATLEWVVKGVALGDALGNRLEFLSDPTESDFREQLDLPLVVSDDTQMMLFSLEAMKAGRSFADAYLRWFSTQGPVASGDGLLGFAEMYDIQAPGMTCMSACKALYLGKPVANDSKGNGTVMRCAHIAYALRESGASLKEAISLAKEDAGTTHKHPFAAMSSMLLTAIHWNLMDGLTLADAVSAGIEAVEVDPAIAKLCRSALDPDNYSHMRRKLGGWVAEEAIALAIGATAHHDSFIEVIQSGVTIAGDSDTVGAIAGGLAAGIGQKIPADLPDKLNVARPISFVLSL